MSVSLLRRSALRPLRSAGIALVVAVLLAGIAPAPQASASSSGGYQILSSHRQDRPTTVGTAFTSTVPGTITTLRMYRMANNVGVRHGAIWLASGERVVTVTFPAPSKAGWQRAELDAPLAVKAGQRYVVGYVSPHSRQPYTRRSLATHPIRLGPISLVGGLGTHLSGVPDKSSNGRYFLLYPFFTPAGGSSPSPSTGFPDASNTGVPAGTELTAYTGPKTITKDGTVIDAKTINGDVFIKADDVVIKNSKINGRLNSNYGGSVSVTDSTLDGGQQETYPTVSYQDLTLNRVEVTGGQHSVQCTTHCTVLNSWLHGQYLPRTSSGHVNAFISNGGNHLVLRHNTVYCTVVGTNYNGSCSGDVSLFGDFEPISDVTIDDNYFKANQQSISYCLYAGYNPGKKYGSNPTRITVTNNVFERGPNGKCGGYGPVTSFLNANGNVWTNNIWADNHEPVRPATG